MCDIIAITRDKIHAQLIYVPNLVMVIRIWSSDSLCYGCWLILRICTRLFTRTLPYTANPKYYTNNNIAPIPQKKNQTRLGHRAGRTLSADCATKGAGARLSSRPASIRPTIGIFGSSGQWSFTSGIVSQKLDSVESVDLTCIKILFNYFLCFGNQS